MWEFNKSFFKLNWNWAFKRKYLNLSRFKSWPNFQSSFSNFSQRFCKEAFCKRISNFWNGSHAVPMQRGTVFTKKIKQLRIKILSKEIKTFFHERKRSKVREVFIQGTLAHHGWQSRKQKIFLNCMNPYFEIINHYSNSCYLFHKSRCYYLLIWAILC